MLNHAGYRWTIRPVADAWVWAIYEPAGVSAIVSGEAPSRPVAAAMAVRAITRGVTVEASATARMAA
jgi:hypothetical protein